MGVIERALEIAESGRAKDMGELRVRLASEFAEKDIRVHLAGSSIRRKLMSILQGRAEPSV